MKQKDNQLRTVTLHLERDRSMYYSFSDIVGLLPVTLTVRRGRISRTSAWFDLQIEGEDEDVQEAAERIRRASLPAHGRMNPNVG